MSDPVERFDTVVIGSGFGGSVVASRLVEAGQKVLLLERGPWRDTAPVRKAGIADASPLPSQGRVRSILRSLNVPALPGGRLTVSSRGYLELWADQGINVLCTSNVGGGSHIWAGLLGRPPAGFWDGMAEGLGDEILASHYDRVERELGAATPPARLPNAVSALTAAFRGLVPLPPDAHPRVAFRFAGHAAAAVDDGRGAFADGQPNGLFGSPGGAKASVDAIYLLPALRRSLELRDLHEVRQIQRSRDDGYRLTVRDHRRSQVLQIDARRVVLCAGTMNSNLLLGRSLQAGHLAPLPALGRGFGANGDLIGNWAPPLPPDADTLRGLPIHGRIAIAGHESTGYMIIGGAEPPPLPGPLGRFVRRKASRRYQIVAMSQDAADGRFWFQGGRFRFAFSPDRSPSYAATFAAFDALGALSGSAVSYDSRSVTTAHPMGGCRIAGTANDGVVNGVGEVFANPGLFVADASVLPRPVGVPPSLSIAAWASHVAGNLVRSIQ